MAEQGLVPIINLSRCKDHWDVAAALTRGHRVADGNCLELVDRNLQPVAQLIVTRIEDGQMHGRLDLSVSAAPDGYVRISPLCSTE